MQTSTGAVQIYEKYGKFKFMVDGVEAELTIYQSEHGFFLPFVDSLAGTETYPAGRYLEPELIARRTLFGGFQCRLQPILCVQRDVVVSDHAGRESFESGNSCRGKVIS